MSRTLFLYIFKDLLRVFLMASGALAGIMSFGGLLRPLTREGLDLGQVARMLFYFGPAMTTYSFPVAALFATAVVYGRLAADNELTACKAGGISLLSLTVSGPALVLGLIVAIASLSFLCFIVPASTLQVEKVIYSNLAKLVETRIERTHEIDLQNSTIFAQEAHLIPPDATTKPGQQRVELIGPAVISTEHDPDDRNLLVAKEFYTASRAIALIEPGPDGEQVNVTVYLTGGFKFPRRYRGVTSAGIESTTYGPMPIPSPIREDVKFMDVWRLKELYADVSKSARLKSIIADMVKSAQRRDVVEYLTDQLNGPNRQVEFNFSNGDRYTLALEGGGIAASPGGVELTAPYRSAAVTRAALAAPSTRPIERPIVWREEREGHEPFELHAAYVAVHPTPQTDSGTVQLNVELQDCVQMMCAGEGLAQMPMGTKKQTPSFVMPMTRREKEMAGKPMSYYESPDWNYLGNRQQLTHEKMTLLNMIIAESNGRASFAVSCLILVMVGCALGMMFRSGNFLTAFAVSFIPAMLSITLIIAGQRTAGNLPLKFDPANGPLKLGLALIWSGNAVNLLLAIGLLWKLGRR